MNILVCTLGASWGLIPEAVGFLAPDVVDLYHYHARAEELARERKRSELARPDEVWLVTSSGKAARAGAERITQWWRELGRPAPLRLWVCEGSGDLNQPYECRAMAELIHRVVLRASEATRGGQLVLSLAGGRKTMSSDLHRAGSVFGASALLHIVLEDRASEVIKSESFLGPISRDIASAIHPVVVGAGRRAEHLDVPAGDREAVTASAYPILLAPALRSPEDAQSWSADGGPSLIDEVSRREAESSRIVVNFFQDLAAEDPRDSWPSLSRLPPALVRRLRTEAATAEHCEFLASLPHADLHCHLGGILDLERQREVARAILGELSDAERRDGKARAEPLLDASARGAPWPSAWPEMLKRHAPRRERAAAAAEILGALSVDELRERLYGPTQPRVGLAKRQGFAAYELPGELSGSALLGHPAAWRPYAAAVAHAARAHGLRLLEIRASPDKYTPEAPAAFVREFASALAQEGVSVDGAAGDLIARFIWIIDRRWLSEGEDRVRRAVESAAQVRSEGAPLSEFFVGLDVAGDERRAPARLFGRAFEPAFASCTPVTIHAGETESAQSIWEAAYHLHADRIGHGLTLSENPELAARFRNRRICLELCPTSNGEVVGYRDPEVPASAGLSPYPLRDLLDLGLSVALCTDNPGICETSPTEEILAANRMSPGGVSLWEALAALYAAYTHSFVSELDRRALTREADREIYEAIARNFLT